MLKDVLARKMLEKGDEFKQNVLARKAGVSGEVVSRLLNGDTKNPGLYTVAKIANALQCSVDELIGKDTKDYKDDIEPGLVKSCVSALIDLYLREKQQVQQKLQFSFDDFLRMFTEVYMHCVSKNLKTVDMEFATLVCCNKFLSSCSMMSLAQPNKTQDITLSKSASSNRVTSLKDNLAKKIAAMGPDFSRKILATRVGTTQESLSLMLTGKMKNPGVYTVAKIARVLNCSVDELIGRGTYHSANVAQGQGGGAANGGGAEQIELKHELAKSCATKIIELLERSKLKVEEHKKLNINLGKFIHIFKEVYRYSLHKRSDTVDGDFVSWFIEYGGLDTQ